VMGKPRYTGEKEQKAHDGASAKRVLSLSAAVQSVNVRAPSYGATLRRGKTRLSWDLPSMCSNFDSQYG